MTIGAAHRPVGVARTEAGTRAAGSTAAAPHLAENLVENVFAAGIGIEAEAAAERAAARTGTRIAARTIGTAAEAAAARLTGGIDLAAIVFAALVGIAEQIVSRRDFLEAVGRLLVALVAVGMEFLRQFAIGLAQVFAADAACDTQNLIGITHPAQSSRLAVPIAGRRVGLGGRLGRRVRRRLR